MVSFILNEKQKKYDKNTEISIYLISGLNSESGLFELNPYWE